MTTLEKSLSILRRAEELVIGRTFDIAPSFRRDVLDMLFHGPWFVISGFRVIVIVVLRCLAATIGMSLLLAIVSLATDGHVRSWQGLWWAALVLGVGAVLLGLPSRIDARSLDQSNIKKLADLISSQAANLAAGRVLREGVDAIQAITLRRMVIVRWVLGLFWASLIWVTSQWVFGGGVPQEMRDSAFSYVVVGAILFFMAGVVVTSYQMAQNNLSQTILFAFLDFEQRQMSDTDTEAAKGT